MSDTDLLWNDVRRSPTTVERERCILEFSKEQLAKKEHVEHQNSKHAHLFLERKNYRQHVTDAVVRQLIWKNVDLSAIQEANRDYIMFLLNGLDKVTGFYDRIPFLIREELIWREWNQTEKLSATLLFEAAQTASRSAQDNQTVQNINKEQETCRLFYFYVSELRRKKVRIPKFDDTSLHSCAQQGVNYMLIPRIRLAMKDLLLEVPDLVLLRQLQESYILQKNLATSIDGMIEIKVKNVHGPDQASYQTLKTFWEDFTKSLEASHAKKISELEKEIKIKQLPVRSEKMTIQTIYSSLASEYQKIRTVQPPSAPVVITHRARNRHGSDVIAQLPQDSVIAQLPQDSPP